MRLAPGLCSAFRATGLALALISLPGTPARAGINDAHTLVVRGQVRTVTGSPLAGARVSARGTFTATATTDDRGRYTLTVPLGAATSLRRGAYALEVRAEQGGRRLGLAAGARALGVELTLVASGTRVRVRSNMEDATSALSAAFGQRGATTAWVEADFSGPARGSGPLELKFADEIEVAGGAPQTTAAAPRPARAVRDSAVSAVQHLPGAGTRGEPLMAAPAPARLDSAASSASTAAARMDSAAARIDPTTVSSAPAAIRVDSLPAPAPPATPNPLVTTRATQSADPVRAVSPAPVAILDTCACRVYGTVEIDWERPRERNFLVGLTLVGPATQEGEVELFMGTPREFRLGPLPCGEYRLIVKPHGRVRYALRRGGSELRLRCYGFTQVPIVLVPKR